MPGYDVTRIIPRRLCLIGMLVCGAIMYFFANVQRVAIPGSVFNTLQSELEVSAQYVTAFGSSFMYVYAVCQLGIGLLVDRYGGSKVIAIGALIFCAGSILFPLSTTLTALYASRALTGLGASSLYLSLVKEITRVFKANFSIFLAIAILIGYAGGIVANAPFVFCAEWAGWRNVMIAVALLSVMAYLLFLLARTGLTNAQPRAIPISISPFWTVLKKRHNRSIFLFTGINFGLYYVLQTVIGKKFLEDFCLFSSSNAAWILSIMGIISAVSGLGFAVISRLLGNRRRIFVRLVGMTCFFVFAAITAALFLDIRSDWIAVLLCLLSCTASTSSIAVPLLRETNVARFTGVSVSILNFCCYMTVAVLGNTVGILMDMNAPLYREEVLVYGGASYLLVFCAMLVLSAVVLWSAFQVKETMGESCVDHV